MTGTQSNNKSAGCLQQVLQWQACLLTLMQLPGPIRGSCNQACTSRLQDLADYDTGCCTTAVLWLLRVAMMGNWRCFVCKLTTLRGHALAHAQMRYIDLQDLCCRMGAEGAG